MTYSVQQVKFELLAYLKEFGGNPTEWRIGTASNARRALFETNAVHESEDIWVWKPMLSAAAAAIVHRFLTAQYSVEPAISESGPHIFMFRKTNAGEVQAATSERGRPLDRSP